MTDPAPMNRREALKATSLLVGGAIVASSGALPACAPPERAARTGVLSPDDRALVEQIADTLLPTTAASPGAKAVGAGAAIDLLLTDCYDEAAQRRVAEGLRDFRERCRGRCGAGFASLAPHARERFLRELDAEATREGEGHWFLLVRELAERAYFSSEVGMTRALRYVRVPGRWVGCVPLEKGQPAWG
jgi:hypothetical protein